MLHLTDAEGSSVEDQHLGEGEHSIGRLDKNEIVIPDNYVSRHHASLYVSAHGVELEDKHSTGGTFVDGMKVSGRVPIGEKQTIQIGDHHLSVSNNEPLNIGFHSGEKLCEDRFVFQQKVGNGASAEVWRAFDINLQEDVALKIFYGEWCDRDEFLPQLRREVKKARKLNHENILNVYDIHVSESGVPLISMEYVNGKSLEDHRIRRGVAAWSELLPLVDQLCSAVDYAHSKKIVHRDIKPANILINQDRDIKLADFGVAQTIVTSTFITG